MATASSSGIAAAPRLRYPFNPLWVALPLLFVGGLIALDQTDVDLVVSGWLYDPVTRAFPLRSTFLLDTLLHHWTKHIVVSIASLAWAAYVLSHAVPALQRHRRRLLFLGLGLSLAPAAVSLLKLASHRYCPWDVVQFGGFAPYLALLEATPAGLPPGHCFPAGHATTGFCLMAFYFVGQSVHRPGLAWSGLALGLISGLGLGFGRMAQGAHFLTHVLWSGIACWVVLVALHALILRPARPAA